MITPRHLIRSLSMLSVGAAIMCAGPVAASWQDPQPPSDPPPVEPVDEPEAPPSTESQPTDDRQPTLDELLGIESNETETGEGLPDIEGELAGETAGAGTISDVFLDAVGSMRDSARRLHDLRDPGLTTQRFQEDAIRKLDLLISMAEQQGQRQQQPQSESQPSPSQPGSQPQQNQQPSSAENMGADNRPPFREAALDGEIDESRVEWGQLPARIRELLMQGSQERSSSLYRRLTERYYQRLAEESQR